jgi:hypothetical protein
MINRQHSDLNQVSIATFSDCKKYRYMLKREWEITKPAMCFIMLNPSTADEKVNDQTIERCQRRAINMGYGSLCIVNLFPLRSTNPNGLIERDPYGDRAEADGYILMAAEFSDVLICAWGNHKAAMERAKEVTELLYRHGFARKMHCLGTNHDGSPKHPLYVPYSAQIKQWPALEVAA